MINFENFIFDLDGTLIDSRKDINSSIKEAIYKTKGVNIDDYSLKIGPPLDVMIRNFFTNITNEEVKEIITNFRSV